MCCVFYLQFFNNVLCCMCCVCLPYWIKITYLLIWAEFQHSVMYYATDQCQKRLEACINAEGGHSEHLLWHCLSDIPITTSSLQSHWWQPTTLRSSSELQRLKEGNKPSVRWKSFAVHKLVWWHFQLAWASGSQIVFLWDNVMPMYDNTVENDFFGYPTLKWLHLTGEVDNL